MLTKPATQAENQLTHFLRMADKSPEGFENRIWHKI